MKRDVAKLVASFCFAFQQNISITQVTQVEIQELRMILSDYQNIIKILLLISSLYEFYLFFLNKSFH